MSRVRYIDGPEVEAVAGASIIETSLGHGVDHRHACGGHARCSTCRIEVVDGKEHCPPPRPSEAEALAVNHLAPPIRLACQLRPAGDVTVRVLLRQTDTLQTTWLPKTTAQEREVAVLTADLRGFTAFAERQLPFDVVHVLNHYFERMGRVVELHRGLVIAFLGDGLLAIFRHAPSRLAEEVVDCALEMLAARAEVAANTLEYFGYDLQMGIGIDIGPAVLGRVGYGRNARFNAIGDVVNTASRIQDFTRTVEAQLLVSEVVRHRLGSGFRLGREFVTAIRGKAGEHQLVEVLGRELG